MKKLNKMLSLLLAVIMVLGMSVTAMADGNYTIKINNAQAGHTYKAYQIFKGTVSESTDEEENNVKRLTSIEWGANVSESVSIDRETDAKKVAETLEKVVDKSEDANAFAKEVATYLTGDEKGSVTVSDNTTAEITGLEAGYYLIKDTISAAGTGTAYSLYMLAVVGDTEVDVKSSVPTVDKYVMDDSKEQNYDSSAWVKSADYSIGDSVPFELVANLADNVDSYAKYKLVFHDTLDAGFTVDTDIAAKVSVVVVPNESETTYTLGSSDGVSVTYTENADETAKTALTITISDLKNINDLEDVSLNNAKVYVVYNATLNDNANIGYDGNYNKVYLEYSNNPNYTGDGTGNGGNTGDNENGTGDGDSTNDSTGKTTEEQVVVYTYELDLTKVIGGTEEALAGVQFSLYTESGYKENTPIDDYSKVATDDSGKISFSGLDAGSYVLVEDATVDGYNKLTEPIKFTIEADHSNDTLTKLEVTGGDASFDVEQSNSEYTGIIKLTVENFAGVTLPTTGGMGTRVIYLIGGALVLCASVLLITKRRMGNSK